MTRTVERLEGLALVGRATVGTLSVRTPDLLSSVVGDETMGGLQLRAASAPSGTRHLVLRDDTAEFSVEYPVAAPEVIGPVGSAVPVGERTTLVRTPLGPDPGSTEAGPGPELLVWANARAQWAEGRPFVEGIRQIRERFGAAPLLWTPRLALPHRIPMLVYLGVDLVDSTEGLLAAAQGSFLDPSLGSVPCEIARAEGACACAACATTPPGNLETHTTHAYRRALSDTRVAARTGRLRELVESRLPAEPALAEMLRYADRQLASLLDERTPVTGSASHSYVILESHRRPEMDRFRRRLIERYRPPPSKTVLLVVPCSRTKPYRLSRSHRRFSSALEGLAGLERLHTVSVSSPIGVVPRELEDVPPARHYDIPVTGEWEEREQRLVVEGLTHLIATGAYRAAVVHLDPEEYEFLRGVFPERLPVVWSLGAESTTSRSSLAALRSAVDAALAGGRPVPGGPMVVVREELHEVAAVQFGRSVADRLFVAPMRLAGRPWFQRLTDGRTDLATLREERGLFHLTVAGARRLMPDPPLAVSVDPSLSLEGDLFAPGVRAADPDIRVGDSVVLLRDGELAGVGEAALPGPLMLSLGRGLAVRVRHRAHTPTDTPKMGEGSRTAPGPVV
jgi:archaeosine synthase